MAKLNMGRKLAHNLQDKWRSEDVQQQEEVAFSQLTLSKHVLTGLHKCGFVKASPIQLKAIPLGLCGFDMVVQAKSGTGKTCVFSVLALETVDVSKNAVQVLVVVPTREIAVQSCDTLRCLGCALPGLGCYAFIGGLPVKEDLAKLVGCHIAVATLGRLGQLMRGGHLKLDQLRLLVLDEADQLLGEAFQEELRVVLEQLPTSRQVVATSATYPPEVARLLEEELLREPMVVRLGAEAPALLGVSQWYLCAEPGPWFQQKLSCLERLLRGTSFSQCMVFLNSQSRAQSLWERLSHAGFPAQLMSGAQGQEQRLASLARLKAFRCRILVSTDLAARGIDAERVNLVVHFDLARDLETHLHRTGRAGRYGTAGNAVILVSGDAELEQLQTLCKAALVDLRPYPGGSVNAINDDTSATGPIEAIAADDASLPHSDSVESTFLQPTAGEALSFEAILNGQVPAPNPNPGLGWPPDNRLYAMARLILQDRNGEYLCSVGKQVEKGSLSCDHSPAAPLLGSSPLSPDPEPSSAPLRNEPPPKVTGPLVRDGLSPRLVGLVGQNRLSRPQRDLPTNATAVSSREQSPFPVTDTSSLSDEPVSSHLKYPPPGRLLPATPQNRRPASFPACSGHCCLERDLGRMTLGYWSQNWRTEYEWYMSRMLGRPSCGRSEGRTTGWDSWVTS